MLKMNGPFSKQRSDRIANVNRCSLILESFSCMCSHKALRAVVQAGITLWSIRTRQCQCTGAAVSNPDA